MTALGLNRFALLVLAALLMAGPAQAQGEGKPNVREGSAKGATSTPETQAVEDVAMAAQLAEYGQRADDPVALITAARILVMTKSRRLDARPVSEGGVQPSGDKDRAERLGLDPAALLAAARDLAGGNETIDQLIESVEQVLPDDRDGTRGNVDGPVTSIDRVQAGATNSWNLGRFRGGEYARAIVDGDGDTDLDCYIYDENGGLITSDTDDTDYCVLSWMPSWTGPFTLRVRNLGSVWNEYVLTTN